MRDLHQMALVGRRMNWLLMWQISRSPEEAIKRLFNQGYRGADLRPPKDRKPALQRSTVEHHA